MGTFFYFPPFDYAQHKLQRESFLIENKVTIKPFKLPTSKQVKYITYRTRFCFVEFCIGTLLTGDRGIFFGLYIKYFR